MIHRHEIVMPQIFHLWYVMNQTGLEHGAECASHYIFCLNNQAKRFGHSHSLGFDFIEVMCTCYEPIREIGGRLWYEVGTVTSRRIGALSVYIQYVYFPKCWTATLIKNSREAYVIAQLLLMIAVANNKPQLCDDQFKLALAPGSDRRLKRTRMMSLIKDPPGLAMLQIDFRSFEGTLDIDEDRANIFPCDPLPLVYHCLIAMLK